jgi:hypothetical protein
VCTINKNQVAKIQTELPNHQVLYVGREHGFKLSGVPLGSELFITATLQSNLGKMQHVIANTAQLKNIQEELILLM